MNPQRVNLITLGVDDMERSRKFYADLGLEREESPPEVSFYRMGGFRFGLFGRAALAKDQGREETDLKTGAITLGVNFASETETDAAFSNAVKAGATILKRPEKVFWGGYSGYFSDPDGHVWEYAFNPFWSLNEDGWHLD